MTRLVCASCNRPLIAATVMRGRQAFGPVCGKRMGLSNGKPISSNKSKAKFSEENQMDLFERDLS